MKPRYLTIVFLILSACLSCDKSEFQLQDFSVEDIDYGDCKSITKSVMEEYLELTTINDYYLSVNHINAMFNCYPGQIIVEGALTGARISINEYSTENAANCICPYDLSYSIGPLEYGTYKLSLKQANNEILEIDFIFNNNLDLKFDIENPY